jgi:hypothetical protein
MHEFKAGSIMIIYLLMLLRQDEPEPGGPEEPDGGPRGEVSRQHRELDPVAARLPRLLLQAWHFSDRWRVVPFLTVYNTPGYSKEY